MQSAPRPATDPRTYRRASYSESPSASPALPHTTSAPFCAMNALMCPTEPRTSTSAPLSEIAQRADASPWTTSSPPRASAPAFAVHATRRDLVHPRAVVADVPVDLDVVGDVDADGDRVLSAGIEHADALRLDVVVEPLVQRPDGLARQIDLQHRLARGFGRGHQATSVGP